MSAMRGPRDEEGLRGAGALLGIIGGGLAFGAVLTLDPSMREAWATLRDPSLIGATLAGVIGLVAAYVVHLREQNERRRAKQERERQAALAVQLALLQTMLHLASLRYALFETPPDPAHCREWAQRTARMSKALERTLAMPDLPPVAVALQAFLPGLTTLDDLYTEDGPARHMGAAKTKWHEREKATHAYRMLVSDQLDVFGGILDALAKITGLPTPFDEVQAGTGDLGGIKTIEDAQKILDTARAQRAGK